MTMRADEMMDSSSQQSLRGEREEPMNAVNRDIITRKLVLLTENFIVDCVMNDLIACKILTFDEKHQIYRNDATDREKVERFVQLFIKKPDSACAALLESLRRTGQDHVANILEDPNSLR